MEILITQQGGTDRVRGIAQEKGVKRVTEAEAEALAIEPEKYMSSTRTLVAVMYVYNYRTGMLER